MTTPHDIGVALDAPELDDIITGVDLDSYAGARRLLVEAIPRAVAAKYSANQIAARLSGVFGRQAVVACVTGIRTAETVGKALVKAGLNDWVSVGASGPDSPVGAWVALSADLSQMNAETYVALPSVIRRVLAPALLTIDPACDKELLEGARAFVGKIQPKI